MSVSPSASPPHGGEHGESTPPTHLSHSSLETWTQCPRRWRLTKLDGVPRAPSAALIAGSAFHAAVEADGRAAVAGQPRLTPAQLAEAAECELAARCFADDPTAVLTPPDRADMRARVLAMLDAYVRVIQPIYAPVAVERELTSPLPDLAAAPGWTFTGRLDALTGGRARGKPLTVVDWKTSGKPWPAGIEHTKDQASAYLLLAGDAAVAEGWEEPPARVTFIVFTTARDATTPFPDRPRYVADVALRTTTRTDDQLGAYTVRVQAAAEAIVTACDTGDSPARTGPLCGWCDVLGCCAEGQAWLEANGRVPAVPLLTPAPAAPAQPAEEVRS